MKKLWNIYFFIYLYVKHNGKYKITNRKEYEPKNGNIELKNYKLYKQL